MPDDFLNVEETLNKLLKELSKIRSANEQIDTLGNIAGETIKIADIANKNSLQLIERGEKIFDQIEKAKLEANFNFIQKQLNENKKITSKHSTIIIMLLVFQTLALIGIIILKYV